MSTSRRTRAAAPPQRAAPAPWLETIRIAMRAFTPDDFDDLHRLDTDRRVVRFFREGKPATRDETAGAIERITHYSSWYPDLGIWYATRRDSDAFIGWFALKYAGRSADVEVGYRLHHDQWGRGFATEGATALVQYGFDDLGLDRIIGVTHPENFASQRVLLKAGLEDRGWGHYYDERLRLFMADRPRTVNA
jgi:ribosomal-protein-alanine N-acetyltransferase